MSDSVKFKCTKCGQLIEVTADKFDLPVSCPACSYYSVPPMDVRPQPLPKHDSPTVSDLKPVNQEDQAGSMDFRKYIAVGAGVGLFIGYLLRPSVALGGQLPFIAVITRGSTLQGLDQMLIPAAQTSFNYMLVGGIVGAVGGFLTTKFMSKK